jgi:hypothetical protein
MGESRAHNLLSLVLNPKHVCSAPLTLSDSRLGARMVDISDQRFVHSPAATALNCPEACNDEWDLCLGTSSGSSGAAPLGGHFTTNNFFAEFTSYRHGRTGARHRRLQLRWWPLPDLPPAPPRGPLSMSSTLVVAAARPSASTPQGPTVDVFNFGGGRCRTCRQHPKGARR